MPPCTSGFCGSLCSWRPCGSCRRRSTRGLSVAAEAPRASPVGRALTIQHVFAVLLFLQLVNMGVRETLDPDMWWHLRTGQLICEHGIPRHDVFSFTATDHTWITHEWLSEV